MATDAGIKLLNSTGIREEDLNVYIYSKYSFFLSFPFLLLSFFLVSTGVARLMVYSFK